MKTEKPSSHKKSSKTKKKIWAMMRCLVGQTSQAHQDENKRKTQERKNELG